jgi:hypothetical protein
LPGSGADGNSNGSVDLADYVIWRKNLGAQAKFFDGAANAGFAVQQPTNIELSDLLLEITDLDARRPADDLSPAIDELEQGSSASPWAVDEAFQDLELGVARRRDTFVSSLAGTRLF